MLYDYNIMGSYQGQKEIVDTFSTMKEAKEMLTEYVLAFGVGWRLWIKKVKGDI